ncbi:BnaCnng45100D, partial [Brassica napus]
HKHCFWIKQPTRRQLLHLEKTFSPIPSKQEQNRLRQRHLRDTRTFLSAISENLKDYVRFTDTAHKAWEDLRMMFVPSVALRIRQLRQRIDLMRQDGDSVARYFGKLKSVWMELSEYDTTLQLSERDIEVREKETLYAFLMGMNKDLSFVRTQITAMCPPPSLDQTYPSRIFDELHKMKKLRSRSVIIIK